jgi:hypothetical protein
MAGSLADVLPTMHSLRVHLIKHREDAAKGLSHTGMMDKIQKAIDKLEKYWNMMIQTPAYLMGVVCDPRRNLDWIKWVLQEQRDECPDEALRLIRRTFDEHRERSRDFCMPESEGNKYSFESWPHPNLDSTSQNEAGLSTEPDREFRGYSSSHPVDFNSVHPMEFWRENRKTYPTWSKIAFEMLSIPASSAEVERVFSRCVPICK